MSEQSTAYYREDAAPRAISTSQLLGQVMFLVAIALGFCALGTLIGRDLSLGTARVFSFAGTAATVLGAGALGFALSKDLAPWMRPVSLIVFAACMGTIIWSLFGGTISPLVSAGIYLVSALLIVIDFNFLRKHGTERDAIWLATGIFVSIVNIFISLLNIFSSR